MGQIERGLNRIYGIEQDRPTTVKYGRAFLLAISVGVALACAFVLLAFGRGATDPHGTLRDIWAVTRWPLALVLVTAALTALLRWAPKRRQPAWSWLAFGAGVSVAGWTLRDAPARPGLCPELHVRRYLWAAGRSRRAAALDAAVGRRDPVRRRGSRPARGRPGGRPVPSAPERGSSAAERRPSSTVSRRRPARGRRYGPRAGRECGDVAPRLPAASRAGG